MTTNTTEEAEARAEGMVEKYDKIIEEWRGRGKIKAIKKERLENGEIRLHYEEGRKKAYIDHPESRFIDSILLEFGGKNEETPAADPMFLSLQAFTACDLIGRGHNIRRITLTGSKPGYKDKNHVEIPNGTGAPYFVGKKERTRVDDIVIKENTFIMRTNQFSRQFAKDDEFEAFQVWLLNRDDFAEYNWIVHVLGTFSRDTGEYCYWRRAKSGDGSKTMELQLRKLNNKPYSSCMTSDLYSAAGDMAEKDCKLIQIDGKPRKDWVCAEALAAGKVRPDHKAKGT